MSVTPDDRKIAHAALQALDTLFDGPAKHTKGSYARNADDGTVPVASADACKWCLLGGLNKVCDGRNNAWYASIHYLALCSETLFPQYMTHELDSSGRVPRLTDVNDKEGYAAIKQLIACGIERTRP